MAAPSSNAHAAEGDPKIASKPKNRGRILPNTQSIAARVGERALSVPEETASTIGARAAYCERVEKRCIVPLMLIATCGCGTATGEAVTIDRTDDVLMISELVSASSRRLTRFELGATLVMQRFEEG